MNSTYAPEEHQEYDFARRLYVWTKMRFISQLKTAGRSVQEIAAELNAHGQHAIDRRPWDAVTNLITPNNPSARSPAPRGRRIAAAANASAERRFTARRDHK